VIQVIELIAVLASTVYGVLLARRHEMDVVGVFSIAFIVALGGGTLRDLILDRHPLFWIEHGKYPVIVFAASLLVSVVPKLPKPVQKTLPVADAVGLGFFSITGAGYALEAETPLFVAAMLGVITGTFGGVIGDVICNEVPSLFKSAPLYATCSFAGCWVFLSLDLTPVNDDIAAIAGIVVIVAARLASLRWDIRFPNLRRPR
jgi:uncharacterized membrane protein YeiH